MGIRENNRFNWAWFRCESFFQVSSSCATVKKAWLLKASKKSSSKRKSITMGSLQNSSSRGPCPRLSSRLDRIVFWTDQNLKALLKTIKRRRLRWRALNKLIKHHTLRGRSQSKLNSQRRLRISAPRKIIRQRRLRTLVLWELIRRRRLRTLVLWELIRRRRLFNLALTKLTRQRRLTRKFFRQIKMCKRYWKTSKVVMIKK